MEMKVVVCFDGFYVVIPHSETYKPRNVCG